MNEIKKEQKWSLTMKCKRETYLTLVNRRFTFFISFIFFTCCYYITSSILFHHITSNERILTSFSRKGEEGAPSFLDTDEEKRDAADVFSKHSYNSFLSNLISLDRTLKDVRGIWCVNRIEAVSRYRLPNATVIVCFHNEALSALLRTVHSLLHRTPPDLLVEILLVDDASDFENLRKPLVDHISKLSKKVKLIRNKKRSGLIRSRLIAATRAVGDVLVFLDSHCEVTSGWVEPLLKRIKENRSTIAVPLIDKIDPDTLEYIAVANVEQRGGFNWDLFYKWIGISDAEKKRRKNMFDPIRTPTMAGGIFGIDRKYFFEMGEYDEQMDIWGGENLEISFRIWMCGGQIEIIPCSRVGHIFRKATNPYNFGSAGATFTVGKNLNRLAEVWLGDYKQIYYAQNSHAKEIQYGDISSRIRLRKNLNCKSFRWYIDNVYPDLRIPDLYSPARGQIINLLTQECIERVYYVYGNETRIGLAVTPCESQKGNQNFVLTNMGEIIIDDEPAGVKIIGHQDPVCLQVGSDKNIDLLKCHNRCGNQNWVHSVEAGQLFHAKTQLCIDRGLDSSVIMNLCSGRIKQKWKFSSYNLTQFAQMTKMCEHRI